MNDPDHVDFPRLYGAALLRPEDVKPLLRDPDLHWKAGRSAHAAAHAWINAGKNSGGGLPPRIKATLAGAPEWQDASVVAGFFEHGTPLDTQRGPSSNDVLVVCGLANGLGVMAVEAKAGESFGEIVEFWNNTPGQARRFEWACKYFGVDPTSCTALRWQLFHRTVNAVIEAERFRAKCAIMLVHDFAPKVSWEDDYLAFARALGFSHARVDGISEAKNFRSIELRLAWVRDTPAA